MVGGGGGGGGGGELISSAYHPFSFETRYEQQ